MRNKILFNISLLLLLVFAFCPRCYADTVDTEGIENLPEQAQVAVACFNYMLNNDYNNFLKILHPEIIRKSGGENKIKESFENMVSQLNGSKVKLDVRGTKRLTSGGPERYLVKFIIVMGNSQNSNIIVLRKTPAGWKVIDI